MKPKYLSRNKDWPQWTVLSLIFCLHCYIYKQKCANLILPLSFFLSNFFFRNTIWQICHFGNVFELIWLQHGYVAPQAAFRTSKMFHAQIMGHMDKLGCEIAFRHSLTCPVLFSHIVEIKHILMREDEHWCWLSSFLYPFWMFFSWSRTHSRRVEFLLAPTSVFIVGMDDLTF